MLDMQTLVSKNICLLSHEVEKSIFKYSMLVSSNAS